MAARDIPSVVATKAPLVSVGAEAWVSTSDGASHPSATAAFQAARLSGRDFGADASPLKVAAERRKL